MHRVHAISAITFSVLLSSVATSSDSANYSLIGGDVAYSLGKQSSSNYSVRSNVSPFNSSRSNASPNIEIREGYLGLLVEPISVDVAISPEAVDEESSVVMVASISYDDGSSSDVSGQGVFASTSWPVEITDAGTIYVGAVSTDEQGDVQISYLGVSGSDSFTVANTLPDNYGSYASDGIPDSWQVNYFGDDNPNGLATADPDRDGQNNWLEFLAGNIPTDASSSVNVRIERDGADSYEVVINKVIPGRTYTLEKSLNLESDWTPVESKLFVENQLNFSFSSIPVDEDRVFFRVTIAVSLH